MESDAILNYWFGELQDGFPKESRQKLWWMGGEETDTEIKQKFGELVVKARNKELDAWKQTAQGRLALIILLDQFTRNVYRGTADAFSADPYALALCKEGVENGHHLELAYTQRIFFYMPLEHSENLADQEQCHALFTQLHEEVPQEKKESAAGYIKYSQQHMDIIKQFGRFPHRNKVLQRENTPEEEKYLSGDHASFGQ